MVDYRVDVDEINKFEVLTYLKKLKIIKLSKICIISAFKLEDCQVLDIIEKFKKYPIKIEFKQDKISVGANFKIVYYKSENKDVNCEPVVVYRFFID